MDFSSLKWINHSSVTFGMSHANSIVFNIGSQYNIKWNFLVLQRLVIAGSGRLPFLNENICQTNRTAPHFYLDFPFIDICVICRTPSWQADWSWLKLNSMKLIFYDISSNFILNIWPVKFFDQSNDLPTLACLPVTVNDCCLLWNCWFIASLA